MSLIDQYLLFGFQVKVIYMILAKLAQKSSSIFSDLLKFFNTVV